MNTPTQHSVNVNKVALVRNTRHLGIPSVTRAAELCLQAGAHGVTVHPRPDERHIRAADVRELAALMQRWPGREYNIEGNPTQNLMAFIREVRPQQATFVPDSEDQFTSDHGWDLADAAVRERLRPLIEECRALAVRVSLFMDPSPQLMVWANEVGADRVELYTEPYAAAWADPAGRQPQLIAYAGAALPLMLLFTVSSAGFSQVLTSQDVATEIVRTLVGSIGLVASVPVTTGLAAVVAARR